MIYSFLYAKTSDHLVEQPLFVFIYIIIKKHITRPQTIQKRQFQVGFTAQDQTVSKRHSRSLYQRIRTSHVVNFGYRTWILIKRLYGPLNRDISLI